MAALARSQRLFGIPADGPRWRQTTEGTKILCDLRDNVQAEIYYLRSYSAAELRFLSSVLSPGDAFLDVGAHCGVFSIPLARRTAPDGQVVAFEPAPDMQAQLLKNAAANGVERLIHLRTEALGERDSEAELRSASDEHDRGRRSLYTEGPVVDRVTVRSLDSMIEAQELDLPRLKAVKIDVEGAELDVLKGMRATLERFKPLVMVEFVDVNLRRAGQTSEAVVEFMRAAGMGLMPSQEWDPAGTSFGVNAVFSPDRGRF